MNKNHVFSFFAGVILTLTSILVYQEFCPLSKEVEKQIETQVSLQLEKQLALVIEKLNPKIKSTHQAASEGTSESTSKSTVVEKTKEKTADLGWATGGPTFTAKSPMHFETNALGHVLISWNAVPQASKYKVKLYNTKGAVVRTWGSRRSFVYLIVLPKKEDQLSADYFVSISSVNPQGEEGPESEKRSLRSHRTKDVSAPMVKTITVEERT